MILAALTLIAILTVSLILSVALIARDLAVEQRSRQETRESRLPVAA